MALQYKKKETESREQFVKKMVDLRRTTEKRPQVYNIESKE